MSRFLSALVSLFLVLCCVGCGDSYDLQSIQVTPASPNIVGIGGSQQFKVTAKYSNGKTQDVTTRSTFSIAPPAPGAPVFAPISAVRMDVGGRVQLVEAACTWVATTNPDNSKSYGTNPYILTVTFSNMDAVSFVSAASLAGCDNPGASSSTSQVTFNVPEQYRSYLR